MSFDDFFEVRTILSRGMNLAWEKNSVAFIMVMGDVRAFGTMMRGRPMGRCFVEEEEEEDVAWGLEEEGLDDDDDEEEEVMDGLWEAEEE